MYILGFSDVYKALRDKRLRSCRQPVFQNGDGRAGVCLSATKKTHGTKKIMLWECSFVSPALHHIMMVISLFQYKGIKIFWEMQTIVVKTFSSPGNAFNFWQLTRGYWCSIQPPLIACTCLFLHQHDTCSSVGEGGGGGAWKEKSLTSTVRLECSCGDTTRTCDLQVMSLASYQLLHSAMYILIIGRSLMFQKRMQRYGEFLICANFSWIFFTWEGKFC